MGLWDQVKREVGKVVREATKAPGGAAPARRSGQRRDDEVPEALRGPDPGTLLSPDEIAAATGSPPVGEGDRRSGGQDLDVGFFRVCIWALADGGQLIVNTTRIRDDAGLELWRSRWDDPSWHEGGEQPLDGIGDAARTRVAKTKGSTELHVDAKQGWSTASLVHTSPAGSRDVAPLVDLMRTLLSRL